MLYKLLVLLVVVSNVTYARTLNVAYCVYFKSFIPNNTLDFVIYHQSYLSRGRSGTPLKTYFAYDGTQQIQCSQKYTLTFNEEYKATDGVSFYSIASSDTTEGRYSDAAYLNFRFQKGDYNVYIQNQNNIFLCTEPYFCGAKKAAYDGSAIYVIFSPNGS